MFFSQITVDRPTSLLVCEHSVGALAPFGDEFRGQLSPRQRGRLIVDAEDGGPKVRLDVRRGFGFPRPVQHLLREFRNLRTAERRIMTLSTTKGVRLVSSLVLPREIPPEAARDFAHALAGMLVMGSHGSLRTDETVSGMTRVILDQRPCLVSIRRTTDECYDRLVGVADDVALCLGAAMLRRPGLRAA